jgi:hypothetical protein
MTHKKLAVLPVLPKLVSGCISLVTGNLTGEISIFGPNFGALSASKPQIYRPLAHVESSPATNSEQGIDSHDQGFKFPLSPLQKQIFWDFFRNLVAKTVSNSHYYIEAN